jgi:hypothetical protein
MAGEDEAQCVRHYPEGFKRLPFGSGQASREGSLSGNSPHLPPAGMVNDSDASVR